MVIGAEGFLGSYVLRELLESTGEDIVSVGRAGECAFISGRVKCVKCDVCDYGAVGRLADEFAADKPKIIYLAASHNVDFVELNPDEARKVNISALDNFIKEFSSFEKFIFSSSDTVYGEGSEAFKFTERSALNPVNVYGCQKAEAEKIVAAAGGVSLRFPFLAGRSLTPAKKHFTDVIAETVLGGESIVMFTDAVRSTLDYSTAAKLIVLLCKFCGELPPVINVCGDEALSKYEIGVEFARSLGVDTRLIIPQKTALSLKQHAPRAVYAAMDNSLIKQILNIDEIHICYD